MPRLRKSRVQLRDASYLIGYLPPRAKKYRWAWIVLTRNGLLRAFGTDCKTETEASRKADAYR